MEGQKSEMKSKREVIDLTYDEIDFRDPKHMRTVEGSSSTSSSSSSAAQGAPAPTTNGPSVIDIDKLVLFGTNENLVDYVRAKIEELQSEAKKNNIKTWILEARVKKADNAVIEIVNLIATTMKKVFPGATKNLVSFSFYWPAYKATECLPNSPLQYEIIKKWWGKWPRPGATMVVGHWWWWFNTATKRQTQKGWEVIYAALHPPGDRVFNNFKRLVQLATAEN